MEPVPPSRLIRGGRALAGLALLLGSGCFGGKWALPGTQVPPAGPAQMVAAWNSKVVYAPDPTRGGAPEAYLMGRLYFFGPEIGKPMLADGNVVIDLYDATPRGQGVDPQLLEELRLDPLTLQRFVKEDLFGDGYTVPFVWRTYRPDISHVNLIMRFDPVKGEPLLHQSGILAVDHAATRERERLQAAGSLRPAGLAVK